MCCHLFHVSIYLWMSFSRLCNFLFVLHIVLNALVLYTFGSEEMDLAIRYVENLTNVSRFDLLIMCLSSTDRDGNIHEQAFTVFNKYTVIMCHLFYVFSISSFILQCFLAFMLFECKLSCIKALQVVKIFMLFECKFIKASRASLRTGGGTMGTWVWLSAFHCVSLHGWTTPNVG